jgi:lipopolysaccharide/colanic/teichoic acid biosynthesis glycosyltransferase
VNFEETVLMDLYYNCNVSLWLDLKILLYTIPVMIFSKGGE